MPSLSTQQYVVKANFNSKFEDLPLNGMCGRFEAIHGKYLTFEKALEKAEEIQDLKQGYEMEKDQTWFLMTDLPEYEGDGPDDYSWALRIKGCWNVMRVWIEERDRPGKAGDNARAVTGQEKKYISDGEDCSSSSDDEDDGDEGEDEEDVGEEPESESDVPIPDIPVPVTRSRALAAVDQNIQPAKTAEPAKKDTSAGKKVNTPAKKADKANTASETADTSTKKTTTPNKKAAPSAQSETSAKKEKYIYMVVEKHRLESDGPWILQDTSSSRMASKVYKHLKAANGAAETHLSCQHLHYEINKHQDATEIEANDWLREGGNFEGSFDLETGDKRRVMVEVKEMVVDRSRGNQYKPIFEGHALEPPRKRQKA